MEERLSFLSDGLKLSAVLHVPEGRKPGQRLPAFIVLHGFVGSKDESHAEIQARMLEGFGYAALRFDFRCCGESEGERGQVHCFDQVADAKNALTFLAGREEVDAQRIGVVGHSFGAAVAVYTAGVDSRFACVVSSCGWGHGERKFRGQHPTPEAWARFTGLLEQGRKQKRETGKSMWISRFDAVPIPEHLRKNLSPKAIMEIPVETAISMYEFRAEDVVGNIAPRPILFFHTADDAVTPTEQSIRMFERAGHPAELMLVTGTSHFPLSPADAPRTRPLIKGWLDKFFPSPLASTEGA
jgi:pimeloyl-ACP methyl ester carboxylesterase